MAAALTVPAHALPARPPQATHVRAEPEPCYTLSGLDRKLQPILDKLRAAPDHAAAQAAATDYATAVKGFSELCSEGNDHPVADLATVLRHVVDAFHSYSEGCGIDCQTTEWIDKGDDPTARFLTVVLGNMGGMYSVTAKSVAVQADAYPKVLDPNPVSRQQSPVLQQADTSKTGIPGEQVCPTPERRVGRFRKPCRGPAALLGRGPRPHLEGGAQTGSPRASRAHPARREVDIASEHTTS